MLQSWSGLPNRRDLDFSHKRAFLESGAAWPGEPAPDCIETHASVVFLTSDRAWKIKKPVRLPHIDLRSLEQRHHFCREEVRLNTELSGEVYRGLTPLVQAADGSLSLGGQGRTVDWLVEMVRLPAEMMLDRRLRDGPPPMPEEIEALCDLLIGFYNRQETAPDAGTLFFDRMLEQSEFNATRLKEMRIALGTPLDDSVLERAVTGLKARRAEILSRAGRGLVVEGHGDLRGEHVCLVDPPVVFDRVEFNHGFRQIDVYDEFNALGLECAMAGAGWIRDLLLLKLAQSGKSPPSLELLTVYGVIRCLTRARFAIDHLRDATPRTPEIWPIKARQQLDAAGRLMAEFREG